MEVSMNSKENSNPNIQTRNIVPESGKVKAFERLLSTPKSNESEKEGDDEKESNQEIEKKRMKSPLPGLQTPKDPRFSVSSSRDSSHGRALGSGSAGTNGGRRWEKQLKPISIKPFELRTEQRGKMKEEEFMKKIKEMMMEQEKQRIPIARGLPWTTDEPEVRPLLYILIKPPVKENTKPIDLRLHNDVRAVERAEFDHQLADKMREESKMERERQQKSSGSARTNGGRRWEKQLKPTSLKPFKLRTEQRGKMKGEELMKKIKEMMMEQEKQRIPIAQGLPWTTDKPQVLIKPPVKQNTRPIDLRLHSDVQAIERAKFDDQVAEKMSNRAI
ncbi:hypothetical protein PTKIN_Ptkin10aG0018600 [Pterospermum kingtungense]